MSIAIVREGKCCILDLPALRGRRRDDRVSLHLWLGNRLTDIVLSISFINIFKTLDTILCRGLCSIGINAKLAPTPRTSTVCYFAFKRHAQNPP
jgi:hypothetical protein